MSQTFDGLIGHWPLADDAEDHGPYRLATRAENVALGAHMQDGTPAARFDGRSSQLRVEDHDALHFGTGDVRWPHGSIRTHRPATSAAT